MLAGFVVWTQTAGLAQGLVELANTFSRTLPTGSARIQAMGGAQTALGGDFSLGRSNPAGLGMYNRSEVALSLGNFSVNTTGDYRGADLISTDNRASLSRFNLPSFGLIFSSPKDKGNFIHGTFGISHMRLNDFNRNLTFSGVNPNTSLIDFFIAEANGLPPSQFDPPTRPGVGQLFNTLTEMAFLNFLINPRSDLDTTLSDREYFTDVSGIPFQTENWETRGNQSQWTFSYGANFGDKLFLGGSVGFVSTRFRSEKRFREEFDETQPLFYFDAAERLDITGSGVNATVGAIYRPIDQIQVGVSYQTPTSFQFTETFTASIESLWDNYVVPAGNRTITFESWQIEPAVTNEYRLRTPSRLNVGIAGFLGRYGVITADIERVNYAGARYRPLLQGDDFNFENGRINETYRAVTNIRAGAEFRYEKLRLRAGTAYTADPFRTIQNDTNTAMWQFTGGIGYRTKSFYVDVAAIFNRGDRSYRPYTVNRPDSPLFLYSQQSTHFIVTVGVPF